MNHNTSQAYSSSGASLVQSAISAYFTGQTERWIWENAWRTLVISTGTMVAGWLLGKTTYLPGA